MSLPTIWCHLGVMPCCGRVHLGYPDYGPFYAVLCRGCGATREAVICVARWVSTSTWWRPSTWGNGHLEFADDHDRKRAEEAGIRFSIAQPLTIKRDGKAHRRPDPPAEDDPGKVIKTG